MIGIGIDTGGTYTDAVVYDMEEQKVLSAGKALTTKSELEIGIAAALDALDQTYVAQAEMLVLSTTLATNACVENKGSRARLLMIGADPSSIRNQGEVFGAYGFQDADSITYLDGKPENLFHEPLKPDWEALKKRIPRDYGDCDAVGVVQLFPTANGGRFEKEAKKVFAQCTDIPVTTAYDMFDQVDVLKRGAGTLLNARLIPLIEEFLVAVKNVMRERHMDMPIAIIRSDGSQMSETLARECPVETLLSGPAASAVGGSVVAREDNAMIVDMGGTTTDVALIQDKNPVTADTGISIGRWKTMVKGLFVDTFVLGGDSAVRFEDGELYLDTRRVIPLSVLAQEYPQVIPKLRALAGEMRTHTRMLHEFFVLQKDIEGKTGYTEEEQEICRALKDGPLMMEDFAKATHQQIYFLHTKRLEDEGIIIRSGITPTDMMVIKGDFTLYDPEAARLALQFVERNIEASAEEIPDLIYDLVDRCLYSNLVRILIQKQFPRKEDLGTSEEIEDLIACSYENAKSGTGGEWIRMPFQTDLPIIGVGAPIHIFLPRVAKLLGTRAIIPENAAVANALGAIASRIVTRVSVTVKAEYEGTRFKGFSVYEGSDRKMFEKYQEAENFARDLAVRQVIQKARLQGASEHPQVKVSVTEVRNRAVGANMFFESTVEAVATDKFQIR